MMIEKIEVWDSQPIFRDAPYAMSHVTSTRAYGRILRVHSHKELSSLGEIVFHLVYRPKIEQTELMMK